MNSAVKDTITYSDGSTLTRISKDTAIFQRAMVSVEPMPFLQIAPHIFRNEFGDTLYVKEVFVAPKKHYEMKQYPTLFDSITPCNLPPVGDNRMASEIIGAIPTSHTDCVIKKDLVDEVNSVTLSFMIMVSVMYVLRSAPYWKAMFNELKSC